MSADRRSLAGVRVLVARAREQAGALSERVRELGGEPIEAPVLVIGPGDELGMVHAMGLVSRGEVAVLALTSPNGVDAVADTLAALGLPAGSLSEAGLLACVGRGTEARLTERLGLRADLLPERATTRSLGAAIPAGRGLAVLPRADLASSELPEVLAAKGYEVKDVVAYRIQRPAALPSPVLESLEAGEIDLVAVTSPSTVHHLLSLLEGRDWSARLVSIGPVTTAACAGHGLSVAAEADPHDLDGLVDALIAAAN